MLHLCSVLIELFRKSCVGLLDQPVCTLSSEYSYEIHADDYRQQILVANDIRPLPCLPYYVIKTKM